MLTTTETRELQKKTRFFAFHLTLWVEGKCPKHNENVVEEKKHTQKRIYTTNSKYNLNGLFSSTVFASWSNAFFSVLCHWVVFFFIITVRNIMVTNKTYSYFPLSSPASFKLFTNEATDLNIHMHWIHDICILSRFSCVTLSSILTRIFCGILATQFMLVELYIFAFYYYSVNISMFVIFDRYFGICVIFDHFFIWF